MKIDLQARNFPLTESLRHAVETEARRYFAEFAERPQALNVRLFDVNGIKHGIDKGCLVSARVGTCRSTVVASGIDSDLYRAITTAFVRLTRGTRQTLNRNRRLRRSAARPSALAANPLRAKSASRGSGPCISPLPTSSTSTST
jgi:putative sigma-54 modulation protein